MINQSKPSNQGIKDKQVIPKWSDCDKASNSSKSGRIATNFTKEQLTKYANKYKYQQKSEVWGLRSGSKARGLKPTRGLEPTAEVWKI